MDYGFRPPVFPVAKIGKVGGSLIFDLDDLASLPLVQGTLKDLVDLEPITVEGGDKFVTLWLNLHASASFEIDPLAGVGSGDIGGLRLGISISNPYTGLYPGTDYNRDPRFDATLTAATVSLPGGVGDFSVLSVNSNGNVHPGEAQLNKCITCGLELKVGIEVAGVTFNLVKGELNTNALNEAFADLLDPDKPDSCDQRQLVLPVGDDYFCRSPRVIIRYRRCRIGYRSASRNTEAETNGRKDATDGGGNGGDERALGPQVAVRPVAVGDQD